ncbi:MAG: lectin [Gemmatimonadota bacterium]
MVCFRSFSVGVIALVAVLVLPLAGGAQQQQQPMGFFITSVGLGNGGDLGGLAGADAHCQALAAPVGAGARTWRAYLSTQATGGQPAVNARDRIGVGPWFNAAGVQVAANVNDLHYNNSNLNYEFSVNERGETVNSGAMGDSPNAHDILTGSQLDGTAFPAEQDRTCNNWTSSGEGAAMLGHHDRFSRTTPGSPWNTAHASQGCSQEQLVATGGAGLFYCFAAD